MKKKVLTVFFLMFITFLFSEVLDINFVTSAEQVTVVLSFTKSPKVLYYGKNENRTVHYFLIDDVIKSPAYLPVSSGTVEGVQIVSINNQVNLFVYSLMPVNATYEVKSTKLYIRFPYSVSSKKLTANFINIKTDVFFKDLAEFFGLKIVLYDSAKNKNINFKANNSTLEEILRMTLSVSGLSYAYSTNQTMYIGTPEEIQKNFATFWQIYDGPANVDKLRQILGTGTYAGISKDKSKLFVFGGLNEYRILTEALIPPAKESWRYISYDIPDHEMKNIMSQISKIYNLAQDSYQVLEEQRKLALKSSVPKEVENTINQMVANVKRKQWVYLNYEISDSEVEQLIERLKKIYSIRDYVIIPATRRLAVLLDNPADLKQIEEALKTAKTIKEQKEATSGVVGVSAITAPQVTEPEIKYTFINVLYPQRIANAMQILYPKSYPKISNGRLYIATGYEAFAESLSKDPIIGNPWKIIIDDVPEEVVKTAIEYLGIEKDNYDIKVVNEKLIITLFASQEMYRKFLSLLDFLGNTSYIVKVDDEYLKKFNVIVLQRFSDGTKLVSGKIKEIERLKKEIAEDITTYVVQQLPTDPAPEIFSKLTGYTVQSSEGLMLFTVSKSNVNILKEQIEEIRRNYSNNIIVLDDKFKPEEKDAIEKIYKVKIYKIDDKIIIYGSLASEAKNMLESLGKDRSQVVELVQPVSDSLSNMLKELFKVSIYNLGNASYIVGTEKSVEEAKKYIESYVTTEVSSNAELTQSHIDYITKVYNVQIDYFANLRKAKVQGVKENVQKAVEYISKLGVNDVVSTTKVTANVKKEDIEKLANLLGIKVGLEQISDILYIRGEKTEVEKITQEIAKLQAEPEKTYTVLNYPQELDEIIKEMYKVKTYKTTQGYVVLGTKEVLNSVAEFISNFVSETDEVILTVSTTLEPKDIETIISIFDRKVKYYKVGQKVYLSGPEKSVEKIIGEIYKFKPNTEYQVIDRKLLIEVKDKNIKQLLLEASSFLSEEVVVLDDIKDQCSMRVVVSNIEQLVENLKTYNIEYEKKDNVYYIFSAKTLPSSTQTIVEEKEEVIVKDGLITINVSNKNVDEVIYQVMMKLKKSYKIDKIEDKINSLYLKNIDYETFKQVFSAWVNFSEIGNITYISPKVARKTETKSIFVNEGLINIKVDNENLSNVIKTVFEELGYHVVFAKPIEKTGTLSVSNIDFDTFNSIMLNYGISIKKTGNVYIVDTTPEATKVRTTYTFNVPRNADKVEELIKFYGGKTMVSPAVGVIVAYDLDPKNVDDINKLIAEFTTAKIVSIEARIVDESQASGLSAELITLFKAGNYVTFGSNGLKLNISILDILDGTILDKILNEAMISFETKSAEGLAPKSNKGLSKLLANPNIMTKSGEEARIFIGDTVPVKISSGGNVELRNLEGGIELRIIPYVNSDNTIDLEISTSVSNFDYSIVIDGLPKINKREAKTKITIKDGQTVVIGGLAREEKSESEWKIPILGDLPIIGMLFRGTKETVERRNITIFLTAKVTELGK